MIYSMRRLFLDPTPTDGGGGGGTQGSGSQTAGSNTGQTQQTPPGGNQGAQGGGGGSPSENDDRVWLPRSEYAELIGHRTAAQAAKEEAANQKRLAEIEAGNGKKVVEELQAKHKKDLDEINARLRGKAVDDAIRDAIGVAGVTFRSEKARTQALALLKPEFSVRENPDKTETVVHKGGRDASVAVADLLKSDDFAHFLNPTTQGGAAAGGGNRPADTGRNNVNDGDGAATPAERDLAAFFKRNRDLAATGRFIPGVNAAAAVAGKHPLGKG